VIAIVPIVTLVLALSMADVSAASVSIMFMTKAAIQMDQAIVPLIVSATISEDVDQMEFVKIVAI
jgi:hypothetical protein